MQLLREYERLAGLALAIADDPKTRVRLGPRWRYIKKDGWKTGIIEIAPLKGADYDEAKGLVNHEVGHEKFTDMAVMGRMEADAGSKAGAQLLHSCWNSIEDVYVERKMAEAFDGAGQFIDHCNVKVTPQYVARVNAMSLPFERILAYIVYRSMGHDTDALGLRAFHDYDDISDAVKTVATSGVGGTYDLALEAFRRMKAEFDRTRGPEIDMAALLAGMKGKPKGDTDEEPIEDEDEAEPVTDEDEPTAEPRDDSAPLPEDDLADEDAPTDGDAPEDEEPEEPVDPDDETKKFDFVELDEPLDKLKEKAEEEVPVEPTPEEVPVEPTPEPKSFEEAMEEHEETDRWTIVLENVDDSVDEDLLAEMELEAKPEVWVNAEDLGKELLSFGHNLAKFDANVQVRRMYAKLAQIMVEASRVRKERTFGGASSGKIVGNRLYKARLGDTDVFAKKTRPMDPSQIAICIAVDCSGSMNGQKMAAAVQSAYLMGEVLDRIGVRFAIYGYTDGMATVDGETADLPIQIMVKDFHQPWRERREYVLRLRSYNSNCDGFSINCFYKRLVKVNARRRLMWVISDGQPAPEPDKVLKRVIPEISKAVDVVGFGLQYWSIAKFYENNVVCGIEDLPDKLAQMMRAMMVEGQTGAKAARAARAAKK